MPRHQLIGLQHADALGDREHAGIEQKLQRPLRRLAARPQMLLVDQHVVVDVADGQRAVLPDQPQDLAQIRRLDRREPFMALALVALHGGNEETQIACRHVGQRMGPVFEHAFVDALGLTQVRAPIAGDPVPQNMVMAALDDVDGVDLHIAEVLDRGRRRRRPRRRTAPACRAAGRAARCAGPRPWSGKWIYRRGTSRGNLAGFASLDRRVTGLWREARACKRPFRWRRR